MKGYIPNQGKYKNSRDAEGFYYHPESDLYTCKNGVKKLSDSTDKYLYQQMHEKVDSLKGKRMKKLRSSTVEQVFGSLINYTGVSRINTKGLKQANKCMIMAVVAYNLKKLLKYKAGLTPKKTKSILNDLIGAIAAVIAYFKASFTRNLEFQF